MFREARFFSEQKTVDPKVAGSIPVGLDEKPVIWRAVFIEQETGESRARIMSLPQFS